MPQEPPSLPLITSSLKNRCKSQSNVALTGLARDLWQLEEQNKPIRIALIGCGEMGGDILARSELMHGIRIVAIGARRVENVFKLLETIYQDRGKARYCSSPKDCQLAYGENKIALSDDLELIIANDFIDIIIDSTGSPEAGAQIGYLALNNNKHLVSMNVETDVTIGPYLRYLAEKNNLLYSLGAGDEPIAAMELIEFISAQGHEIIAAGKGKNNPLNIYATPRDYEKEARERSLNPRMLVEFIDGSKTMLEMAALANASGLTIDCPAMHGPKARLSELDKIFIPKKDGGILTQSGVVDYSIGPDIAPGVFVIAKIEQARLRQRLSDLKMGGGPYFTFYRPYHLTAMEVPLSCARLMLYKKIDMQPLFTPQVEVCAHSKKALKKGERLDFIGLYSYRAYNLTYREACAKRAVPIGLLQDALLIKDLAQDELITYDHVQLDQNKWIYKLRQKQEALLNSFLAQK